MQSHIQLAKEEIVTELKQAGRGAGLVGGAALAGWIALLLLSFAAAWGLSELVESVWAGFLVVGLVWAVMSRSPSSSMGVRPSKKSNQCHDRL